MKLYLIKTLPNGNKLWVNCNGQKYEENSITKELTHVK